MPDQTITITAPNGQRLRITGDHVPNEAELRDIFKGAGITPDRVPTPVKSDEPDSYWAGFLKGAAEGIRGGATGFVKGLADAPGQAVAGFANLVTDPIGSIASTVEGIKQIPEAIQYAGNDPEAWGRGVGNVTGQVMLTEGTMRGIPAGARAVRGKVSPKVLANTVRVTAPVAGAKLMGLPGAAVGGIVGDVVARGIENAAPAEAATVTPLQAAIQQAVNEGKLRQVPEGGRVIRGPDGRPIRVTTAPGEAPVTPEPQAPVEAPAPPTAPTATAPTPPSTPIPPGVAFKQALDAFKTAGEAAQRGEVSWVTHYIQQGYTPADAVAKVVKLRPPASPTATPPPTPAPTKVAVKANVPPSDWFDEWAASHTPEEISDLLRSEQGRAMPSGIKDQLKASLDAAKKARRAKGGTK